MGGMAGEHRFLQPNPVLLDDGFVSGRKRSHLAHDLGAGSRCVRCGDQCPGFQLHYWRKVCQNCRCGKAEHNVVEEHDPGFYFVGKIFDRPLRTKEEEMEFCYGDTSSSGGDDEDGAGNGVKKEKKKKRRRKGQTVRFDWIPPNISLSLAKRYLEQLPPDSLPISGSQGSRYRKQQLEKQFPVHDIEPEKCHELTQTEIETMEDFVRNVRTNVVGQGMVTQVSQPDLFPPPLSPYLLHELTGHFSELSANDGRRHHLDRTTPHLQSSGLPPPTLTTRNKKTSDASTETRPYLYQDTSDDRVTSPRHDAGGSSSNSSNPSFSVSRNDSPTNSKKTSTSSTAAVMVRSCEECNAAMRPGDVAVIADRAGPDKLWHPSCFKCSVCREILVDLLYYYDSGRVFCARHYAWHANIPRCHACDELIFAAEYTGAEDHVWHIKHFCCYECDRPLAGLKYIPIDSHPHCLLCYRVKHGKICRACGEYIDPEEQRVSLQNEHWHARSACFKCAVCTMSLLRRKMTKKGDLILCSSNCIRKARNMPGYRKDSTVSNVSSSQSILI